MFQNFFSVKFLCFNPRTLIDALKRMREVSNVKQICCLEQIIHKTCFGHLIIPRGAGCEKENNDEQTKIV